MRQIVFTGLLILEFFVPGFVLADTIIDSSNSYITTDTSWTKEGSPYTILDSVFVRSPATLSIEKGTVVKFASNTNINVFGGSIMVKGVNEDPIYFTPVGNENWGLNIAYSPLSSLAGLKVSHCGGGIFSWDSVVEIKNLEMNDSSQGVSMAGEGKLNITDSTFKNIGAAISGYQNSSTTVNNVNMENISGWEAIALFDNARILVNNSSVKNSNYAYALGVYGGSAEVESSTFSAGLSCGISLSGSNNRPYLNIKNSVIEDYMDAGVSIYQAEANMDHVSIRNNFYGVLVGGPYPVTISQSSLTGNLIYAVLSNSLTSINAENNWWGDESGPYEPTKNPEGWGDEVSGNINFVPWLHQDPTLKNNLLNPVIIIPGIMGSAYKNGQLVIDPILHTYDDLIETLAANGYEKGKTLFDFPYEWRDSNIITANLLKNKINEVKSACSVAKDAGTLSQTLGETDCSKVDLVAHSMGGLVSREYIQSGQYQHDVDQLIFLGTPHQGSPKAYLQWEAGEFPKTFYDFLTKKFFEAEAKENGYKNLFSYIQMRPISTVQELLPIFDYLKDKSTGDLRIYPDNYPRNNFLEYLNRDTDKLLNSGVKITNITGDAGPQSTLNLIRVGDGDSPLWINGKPDGFDGGTSDRGLEMGTGDGTVTTYGNSLDDSITDINITSDHQRLPTLAEGKVVEILSSKKDPVTFDHHYGVDIKVMLLQLLSPIDVVITDPQNRKMGKNFETGEEYNEIPGAFYTGYNTDKEYITIPNPEDGEYKFEVQGTGIGGEYGVLTSIITDTLATTTEKYGITEPGQITELSVEFNSQNPSDLVITKNVTLEVLINDINQAYKLGWIKEVGIRDMLIAKVQKIFKGKKPAKSYAQFLSQELKMYNKEKISEQAYNIINEDLNYLLNN